MPAAERARILRLEYRNLGWLLAEFCQMSTYTPAFASRFIRYEGLEHYLAARDRGQGVLVLTGHLGAWELSSFYHSLAGYPMGMVIRRLDNPLVDRMRQSHPLPATATASCTRTTSPAVCSPPCAPARPSAS